MKRVVVAGYPKSGNTWLVRLVAEWIGCKVAGFWGSDHAEIASEGEMRSSDYVCYKSHHGYSELMESDLSPDYIINIVRDPRDIVLSGLGYFKFIRFPVLSPGQGLGPWDKMHRFLQDSICTDSFKLRSMVRALVEGNVNVHHWCRVSWGEYYSSFVSGLMVRYEDLLDDPLTEGRRVLSYLGLNRSEAEISQAIENQSFSHKKAKFLKENDKRNIRFMRQGGYGGWKEGLDKEYSDMLWNKMSRHMEKYGYVYEGVDPLWKKTGSRCE